MGGEDVGVEGGEVGESEGVEDALDLAAETVGVLLALHGEPLGEDGVEGVELGGGEPEGVGHWISWASRIISSLWLHRRRKSRACFWTAR